jgi:hypothetical protein
MILRARDNNTLALRDTLLKLVDTDALEYKKLISAGS